MSGLLSRDGKIVVQRGLGGVRGVITDACSAICCPDCWYFAETCGCTTPVLDNVLVPCSLVTASTVYFKHGGHCWYVDNTHTKVTTNPNAEVADISESYSDCDTCINACDALGTGCGGTSGIQPESAVTVTFCRFDCRITNRCYYPVNQACGHETPTLPTDCTDATADCDLPALPTCGAGVIGKQSILQFNDGIKANNIVVPFDACPDPPSRAYTRFVTQASVQRTFGNFCDQISSDCVSSPFTWRETQASENWYADTVPVEVRLSTSGGNFVYTLIAGGLNFGTITLSACTSSGSRTDNGTTTQESTPNVTICSSLRRSCQTVIRYNSFGGDTYASWSITPAILFC